MKIKVSIIELVKCISQTLDLISPIVTNHHRNVATIAYYLCEELGISKERKKIVTIAASLHDVGIITNSDLSHILEYDIARGNKHSEVGYYLLKSYPFFENIAKIIRYHHVSWNYGNSIGINGEAIPYESYILSLADRVSILIDEKKNILTEVERITESIVVGSGNVYENDSVLAFLKLSKKESFWLDIINKPILDFPDILSMEVIEESKFLNIVKLFSRLIDFRSHYTATHSSRVAAIAKAIAQLAHFSNEDVSLMEMAGLVHDLGKIVVPTEILEKPGKLTHDEYAVMRTHTYYTDLILRKIPEFATIREWGAKHHEKLNGSGYPFHLRDVELSLGSRIMTVADIFAALTEERPYRGNMPKANVLQILSKMVENYEIDSTIVQLVNDNYDYINECGQKAKDLAEQEYQNINL